MKFWAGILHVFIPPLVLELVSCNFHLIALENNRANQFPQHIFRWNYLRFSVQPRKSRLNFQMEKHVIWSPRTTLKTFGGKQLKLLFSLCGRDGDKHLCLGLMSEWRWCTCSLVARGSAKRHLPITTRFRRNQRFFCVLNNQNELREASSDAMW